MITPLALSNCIGNYYDAALGKARWRDALGATCVLLKCQTAIVGVFDIPTGKIISTLADFGIDPYYIELFNEKYANISPFALAAQLVPAGQVGKAFDVFGREENLRSRFYLEWCKPQRFNDFIGPILNRSARTILAQGFVRFDDQPLFDETDAELLEILTPHIMRAIEISGKLQTLQAEREDLLASIDTLPSAMFIVDGELRIQQCNGAAYNIAKSGAVIFKSNNRLSLSEAAADTALNFAFGNGGIQVSNFALSANASTTVSVVPLRNVDAEDPSQRRGLIIFYEVAPPVAPPADLLRSRFDLSFAEIRLLMMLINGGSRQSIADDLGVSLATIKTQLQSLFQKTETTRQLDLIRKVSAFAPLLGKA